MDMKITAQDKYYLDAINLSLMSHECNISYQRLRLIMLKQRANTLSKEEKLALVKFFEGMNNTFIKLVAPFKDEKKPRFKLEQKPKPVLTSQDIPNPFNDLG